jgi:hypothetical protein
LAPIRGLLGGALARPPGPGHARDRGIAAPLRFRPVLPSARRQVGLGAPAEIRQLVRDLALGGRSGHCHRAGQGVSQQYARHALVAAERLPRQGTGAIALFERLADADAPLCRQFAQRIGGRDQAIALGHSKLQQPLRLLRIIRIQRFQMILYTCHGLLGI